MKTVPGILAVVFGLMYLMVAIFMALFIGLMAHGGFTLLIKSLGIEL
jgi:hypothetical protein